MKQVVVFLGLLALTSAGTAWKGGLKVRFEYTLAHGKQAFYDMPRTVEAAKAEGYTKRTRPIGDHLPSLELYCPYPATVCLLFDDTGYIAGMQIAVPDTKFKNHFNLERMGMKKWVTTDGTYHTLSEFFVSEEFLGKAKEIRISSRNPDTMLQAESVWLAGVGGKLYEVPRDEKKIDQTEFTKQACMPWMGQHYYYNMTSATECTAEGMFPWFPMYDDNELVGVGFVNFGPLEIAKNSPNYFETPDRFAVQVIVPRGPECLYQMAESPGTLTMHTYFVQQPWMITCLHMPKFTHLSDFLKMPELPKLPQLPKLPHLPKIPYVPFFG